MGFPLASSVSWPCSQRRTHAGGSRRREQARTGQEISRGRRRPSRVRCRMAVATAAAARPRLGLPCSHKTVVVTLPSMCRRRGIQGTVLLLLGLAQTCSPHSHPDATASRPAPPFPELPVGSAGCDAYLLAHGRARPTGAVRHISTIALSCDPGYELAGPGDAKVQCLFDGSFTPGKMCRPVSCGALAVLGGIADPSSEIVFPNTATITCGRGYTLSSSDHAQRRCLSSGRFSDGAHCVPTERWAAADVRHARADLLAELELLVTGQDFIPGAFYECHFTLTRRSGACTRISTEVLFFCQV